MADTKVSALIPATTLNLTDELLLVQAGNSIKLNIETLALKMPSRIIINETSETVVTGAIATNTLVTKVSATTAGAAYTLAAGTHGMEKVIVCSSAETTPTGVVTVTGGTGVSTITFNAAGQSVALRNVDGSWYVMSTRGAVVA